MDLHELTDLRVLPLRVITRALDPIELPDNPASTLRGAFGGALRRMVCVEPHRPECAGCPLEGVCVFPAVFEPRASPAQPGTSGFQDLPRPYVLRGLSSTTVIPPGDRFTWEATLIGRAIEQLPYFALAWRAMGDAGIGRGRGRYLLERLETLGPDAVPGECLYARESNCLRTPTRIPLPAELGVPEDLRRVEVRFLTPMLLKRDGRPIPDPQFPDLWRAVQLRLSLLRLAHGAGRPTVDFAGSIARAGAVRRVEWNVRQVEWRRYSQRQRQKVPMQGFVGCAVYEGDLAPFLPSLRLGSRVGAGDNCTFGQGAFSVEPQPPESSPASDTS